VVPVHVNRERVVWNNGDGDTEMVTTSWLMLVV